MENEQNCCFEDENMIENEILNDGVSFFVQYVGCVEIFCSMKQLDFSSRSLVAKFSINRVCELANLKSPKKRKVDKRVQQCVSDEACLEHSGVNVVLNISATCLQLSSVETGEVVASHDMPNISFASGGDSDSTNFVAYVAKDTKDGWRACYVVDCGIDKAQTVISTMGQAFELRYKNFCGDEKQRKSKSPPGAEYYNDLPNKVPPTESSSDSGSERRRERLHSNLIDLNVSLEQKCDYVNESDAGSSRDVFDMQCFSLPPEVQHSQLLHENWFHGPISRNVAEALLRHDGDFIVRQSQGPSYQYVLTGLNSNQPKHLLLIDPEGVVRTKDRVFENITHLINYHWSNRLPIISADSALLLQNPVMRK